MGLSSTIPGILPLASVFSDAPGWLLDLPGKVFSGYSWLLESGVDLVHSLYEDYGYWVIFLGTLFENTLLLGLIVPGVLIILLAGVNAQEGSLSVPAALGVGILGTVLGDILSYLSGRFGWARVSPGSLKEFTEKVREPIIERGPLFIVAYHFIGYGRLLGPTGAGMLRMPYRRWAPADHLGAVLWVGFYLAAGYGLGAAGVSLSSSDRWFRYFEWGLLAFVLIWLVYLYRAGQGEWVRSLRRKLAGDEEEPEAEVEPEPVVAPSAGEQQVT